MGKFGEKEIAKEIFYAVRKPKKIEMLILIIWLSQNQLK